MSTIVDSPVLSSARSRVRLSAGTHPAPPSTLRCRALSHRFWPTGCLPRRRCLPRRARRWRRRRFAGERGARSTTDPRAVRAEALGKPASVPDQPIPPAAATKDQPIGSVHQGGHRAAVGASSHSKVDWKSHPYMRRRYTDTVSGGTATPRRVRHAERAACTSKCFARTVAPRYENGMNCV